MKIMHVVGARPNFMKMAPVRAALENQSAVNQVIVHTGQHYDPKMSDIFFKQLGIPKQDYDLKVGSNTHAQQTANIMIQLELVIQKAKPDILIVYGDVNSTLAAALVCSKLSIPIAHVESGLRSFDNRMPEEINRILTDRISDILFTPSLDADSNLINEGIPRNRIKFVGNVMIDTLIRLLPLAINSSFIKRKYILLTLHRPSNVDDPLILRNILNTINSLDSDLDIIFPVHPRTNQMIIANIDISAFHCLHILEPLGYLEFLGLQRDALLVITDSGGIQTETTFLGVPCITVRENTEWPVTISVGTNILVGLDMNNLKKEAYGIISGNIRKRSVPPLWDGFTSQRIVECLLQ